MPNLKHYLFASLLLGLPQSGIAGGIEQLRAYIQGTQSLRAEFQQVVSGKRKTTQQEASGSVSIQRPGKFRWVYAKPYEQPGRTALRPCSRRPPKRPRKAGSSGPDMPPCWQAATIWKNPSSCATLVPMTGWNGWKPHPKAATAPLSGSRWDSPTTN